MNIGANITNGPQTHVDDALVTKLLGDNTRLFLTNQAYLDCVRISESLAKTIGQNEPVRLSRVIMTLRTVLNRSVNEGAKNITFNVTIAAEENGQVVQCRRRMKARIRRSGEMREIILDCLGDQ